MDVTLVLGTRPQIIKSASFVHSASKEKNVNLCIVHTGQHYDYEMARIFFDELSIRDPIANLNVGSDSHARQTAKIMIRLEKVLRSRKPDLVIVPGDTNSTLAAALASVKLHIPIAHVEAGARSYDMKMPEEINRRLTDHCSTLLFAPTENCLRNLKKEGIDRGIHQTGDSMYDILLQQLPKAREAKILEQLNLESKSYVLLTTHRTENVDQPQKLGNIVKAMAKLQPLEIVFPAHPRTVKELQRCGLYNEVRKQGHIKLVKPLGYHETLKLIENAKLVLTDSGGMQKEAFWLKTPCVTLRENTEWIETVQLGANFLAGASTQIIIERVEFILEAQEQVRKKLQEIPNPFGDGNASHKMLEVIKDTVD